MGFTSRLVATLFCINLLAHFVSHVEASIVINTWSGIFEDATLNGFTELAGGGNALDGVEAGCRTCENEQCDGSVGFGNHPDTLSHTSLDAMIMDGDTMDVGSVGYIKGYRNAITVARYVMYYTSHTLLVGEGAEVFAKEMGLSPSSATTNQTIAEFQSWKEAGCQPNYFENIEQAKTMCGPYYKLALVDMESSVVNSQSIQNDFLGDLGKFERDTSQGRLFGKDNHDTIGIVTIDDRGSMACGTTTNGANHKVAGRVGDSPITGAGCYVDTKLGAGATATGDGDVMMRFLPAYYAVMLMGEMNLSPNDACQRSIARIAAYFPDFSGGLVCVNSKGEHGGATHNMNFSYSFMVDFAEGVQVVQVI